MSLREDIELSEKYFGETDEIRAIKRWLESDIKIWQSVFSTFFDVKYHRKPNAKHSYEMYPEFVFKKDTIKIIKILYPELKGEKDENIN